jgi:four helix bundle protein
MNNFEELEVWRMCRKFRNDLSILVKAFPMEERYRIIDQLLRSSRSITTNIAEGYGRFNYQENIRFCRQARGSLSEALDHLL